MFLQNMLTRSCFLRSKLSCLKQIFQQKCISMTPYFHYSNEEQNYVNSEELVLSSKISGYSKLNDKFKSVTPELIETITEIDYLKEIPHMKEFIKRLFEYNLFDGKKNRGLQTVIAYQMFSPQSDKEDLKLACLLGWCVELLQAFYLVHDDIIDGSELRRGRLCWYRFHENGLNAINDGVLLENSIYVILRKYFKNKPYYVNIIESFHDVTMKTSIGQVLDMQVSKSFQLKKTFNQFTLQQYSMIVKYKTAYYSFQLPVTVAMYMASITEKSKHDKASNILLDVGLYFQIQDDFLDCYGDKETIGKSGNDIAEGKCTWLLIQALHKANNEQKKILQENYGNPDPDKVKAVVQIYNSLGLQDEYERYEKQLYDELMLDIRNIREDLPHEIFTNTLNKIHKRKHYIGLLYISRTFVIRSEKRYTNSAKKDFLFLVDIEDI